MQNNYPIRIGIIGAGAMTNKRHLPALSRLQKEEKCELVAICDLNLDAARAAAKKFDIPHALHDALALIARDDIDAVCIFAPADVHYRKGLQVLEAGKHLFVEKPPAQNSAQILEMVEGARQKNLIAVAGFNRRFQKPLQNILKETRPEAIESAEAVFHKRGGGNDSLMGMRTLLGANSIHAIDALCYVMGERPTALFAARGGVEGLETFSALIRWGERHATLSANNFAGERVEHYAFHGGGRSFEAAGGPDEGIYEEFAAFFEAIESNTKPIHSLEHAVASLHLVDLIEKGHQGPIDWSFVREEKALRTTPKKTKELKRKKEVLKSPGVLILNPQVMKKELPALVEHFTIRYEENLSKLSLEERTKIAAVITGGPSGALFTQKHFELLPELKAFCVVGSSIRRWGGELVAARGIPILNTAEVYADAVAEFVVMQALIGVRRASVSHEAMRRGGWGFSAPAAFEIWKRRATSLLTLLPESIKLRLRALRPPTSPSNTAPKYVARMLRGRTVGIVGFGDITKKTIPLFVAHGCKVLVYSEHLSEGEARSLGAESTTLQEVLRCDIVSLQRGLSQRTARSFGAQEINSLRPGTVFINSGRAGLVDNEALLKRLKKGDIFACLDVFDEEPLPANDELRALPNVFLTSHLAARQVDALLDLSAKRIVEKLAAFVEGKEVEGIREGEYLANMT